MDVKGMKRTWAEIDLDALSENYKAISRRLSGGAGLMAVVKADAYGHGALACSKRLECEGAACFAVSSMDEAVQLRQGGIEKPILILGYTLPEDFTKLSEYDITQTVFSFDYARMISECTSVTGKKAKVHIKVDTGMNRLGFKYTHTYKDSNALEAIQRCAALPFVEVEGIFTHFAESDTSSESFTRTQFSLFCDAIERLEQKGVRFDVKHCCNSAAFMKYPEMHMDMVRCGLIMYGLYPTKDMEDIGLKPVMQLKTRISQIHTIASGESVSYNRTYRSFKNTKVATLSIGYADGFSRRFSNSAQVLINSRRAPVIGRICMDQSMADITGIPADEGDVAVIFGGDPSEFGAFISVEELAELMESVNYEVVCLVGKRVPRIYYSGGVEVETQSYFCNGK
ncbi:MAG: alanine racemase [Eubacteriales bacterium]